MRWRCGTQVGNRSKGGGDGWETTRNCSTEEKRGETLGHPAALILMVMGRLGWSPSIREGG